MFLIFIYEFFVNKIIFALFFAFFTAKKSAVFI